MKNPALICLLIITTVYSCKRDDPSGPTSSNLKIHQPPPAGFTFPHTYSQQNKTSEFKVWVDGKDITSTSDYKDYFGYYDPNISDFDIRLVNANAVEMIVSNQVVASGTYFFANDTLFIISSGTSPYYQESFAKGSYSGFTIKQTAIHLTGTNDGMENSFVTRLARGSSSYESVSKFAQSEGFTKVDTLAYYNSSVEFK